MRCERGVAASTMESLSDSHTPDARARDAHELRQTTLGKMARVTEPPRAKHSLVQRLRESFGGKLRIVLFQPHTSEELRYDLEIFILAP